MNRKGFTLMEVLVVVIILAAISLITFPLVKDIIEKNRKKTFEEALDGVIRSTQLYISANAISEDFVENYNTEKIAMEKNNFQSGTIRYINGKIILHDFFDGNYCASGTKENMTIVKGACPPSQAHM